MLEDVGDARDPVGFVGGPDVGVDVEGDDGSVMTFEDDELHAVPQGVGLDQGLDRVERLGPGGEAQGDEESRDQDRAE